MMGQASISWCASEMMSHIKILIHISIGDKKKKHAHKKKNVSLTESISTSYVKSKGL